MCIEEKKCDPNVGIICEMTPLSIAICSNALKAVQQLITLNVDINKADEDGITPLMYAACKNNQTITTILLQNGADLKAIQTMLGHSDISSTQVYMQFQDGNLKNIYKKAHPRA